MNFGFDGTRHLCLRIFFATMLTGILFPLAGTNSFAAELTDMILHSKANSTQVTLLLDDGVRYKQSYLHASGSSLNRCYIDLYSTSRGVSVPAWQTLDDELIAKIRTGVHATTLRVVLDLRREYECSIDSSADSSRITLQVSKTSPESEQKKSVFSKTELEDKINLPKANIVKPQAGNPEKTISKSPELASSSATETEPKLSDLGGTESNRPSFWGWIKAFSAKDLQDDPAEDHHLSRARARVGTEWHKEISIDYLLQFKGAVDIDRIFYADSLADDDTDINLHETYLQFNAPNWDISFGKQRVRWGKSDQLSPVDSINPQDYRQSMAIDLEERAIPSWLLRSRWYGETIGVETIIQPWFEKSEIEYFDSDWALYRNLRQSILTHPAVPMGLKDYARTFTVAESKPDKTLDNMSAALRLTLQTEQTDYALSYHYGWETLPTINSFPVSGINFNGDPDTNPAALLATSPAPTNNQIEAGYERQQTIGFEWETVFDPIGFRGEITHIDKVSFLNSNLTSTRKNVTHLVSGIDYTSESEWYFNFQGSWQHIHEFDNKILYFDKDTIALFGEIRKPVWRGNLEFATKYNFVVTDQSSYVQPSVTLKYFRNVECEIGAMFYSGDGDTLLGSYDKADQVYGIIKYRF